MTYDLNQTVKDYEGKDVMESGESATPTTFKYVVTQALNSNITPQDTPEDKAMMYAMTMKAYLNPSAVEYDASEVAFLLKRVKIVFFPLVVGRAEEFFNQKN